MKPLVRGTRVDVALMVLYLGAALPLQVWTWLVGALPWMNYGHGWSSLLAYGVVAPTVAYLLWRRSGRARLAAYVFLSSDSVRSVREAHWLPLALDLAILAYLQTPAMYRVYPSMLSRVRAARERKRVAQA